MDLGVSGGDLRSAIEDLKNAGYLNEDKNGVFITDDGIAVSRSREVCVFYFFSPEFCPYPMPIAHNILFSFTCIVQLHMVVREYKDKERDMTGKRLLCLMIPLILFGFSSCKKEDPTVAKVRKQAEEGDASAQYELGSFYYDGSGVIKNYETAVEWFLKAADQGYVGPKFHLGLCYYYGKGVARNHDISDKWMREYIGQVTEVLSEEMSDKDTAEWLDCRATAYSYCKDYRNAIADSCRALSLDPDNLEYLVNRSYDYLLDNQADAAGNDIMLILQKKPEDMYTWGNLGHYFAYYKHDFPRALECYEKSFSLGFDPNNEDFTDPDRDGKFMKEIIKTPEYIALLKKYKK